MNTDEMLAEETRIRTARGLPKRTIDDSLQRTATELAAMLAVPGAPFSHGIGGGMSRRLASHGWSGSSAAENIAYGSDTVAATFDQWMRSPGHRKNILSDLNLCGFGHAVRNGTHYWAACYGSKSPVSQGSGGWWSWIWNLWR